MDEITPNNQFIIIIGLDREITLPAKVQNDYKFEKGESLLIKVYPKRMII